LDRWSLFATTRLPICRNIFRVAPRAAESTAKYLFADL
jgi:hypothetical protein